MEAERDCIGLGQQLVSKLTDRRAAKYLDFGFNKRALQIHESRFQLKSLLERSGGEKLDPYRNCHMNIFLNSFYLNLLGSLDNLAWILQHQLNVIDSASPENGLRNKIGLFHRDFSKRLLEIDADLASEISGYKEWYEEIIKFRHPSAHRMPLYTPPGVMFDKHIPELEELKKEADNIDYKTDPEQSMDNMHKQYMVGEYQPLFISFSEEGQDSYYHFTKTIGSDNTPFWKLSKTVLVWLSNHVEAS